LLQINDYFKQKFAPKFPLTIFISLFLIMGHNFRLYRQHCTASGAAVSFSDFPAKSYQKFRLLAKINSLQVRGASNKKYVQF
jgi:hypothetical protein